MLEDLFEKLGFGAPAAASPPENAQRTISPSKSARGAATQPPPAGGEEDGDLVPLPLPPFATSGATFSALNNGVPDGYRSYIGAHIGLLEVYTTITEEAYQLGFLADYETLTAGVAYVRHWFFTRHLDMHAQGADFAREASNFFLLDAVADAARHHHARHLDSDVASSANAGVQRIANDLGRPDEAPSKLRKTLSTRTLAWIELIRTQDARSQLRSHLAQQMQRPTTGGGGGVGGGGGGGGRTLAGGGRAQSFGRSGRQSARSIRTDPARGLRALGYEPLGPIAAGAFSTILRARSLSSGCEVAVKSFDQARCAKDSTFAGQRDHELEVLRLLHLQGQVNKRVFGAA